MLWLTASPVFGATIAIRAGKAIDPNGKVIANAVIVVDDDRIKSIGTGAPPAGVDVIDLTRYTVIPGMIDVHTHMTYFWDRTPGTRPLGQPRRPEGVMTALAAENARRTLETGVTTVRDLGASREGQWTNSFQTGDEWLTAMKKNPNPVTFREPITNVTVTIDGDRLAYLRADFQVMRDGQAQSKGVDQFTLVREASGWKIAVVAYTSLAAR